MSLACPDCGAALTFRDLTNGTAVCECSAAECRADWMSHGQTREEAADKLVALCEQYGYVTALSAKLAHAYQEAEPGEGHE